MPERRARMLTEHPLPTRHDAPPPRIIPRAAPTRPQAPTSETPISEAPRFASEEDPAPTAPPSASTDDLREYAEIFAEDEGGFISGSAPRAPEPLNIHFAEPAAPPASTAPAAPRPFRYHETTPTDASRNELIAVPASVFDDDFFPPPRARNRRFNLTRRRLPSLAPTPAHTDELEHQHPAPRARHTTPPRQLPEPRVPSFSGYASSPTDDKGDDELGHSRVPPPQPLTNTCHRTTSNTRPRPQKERVS